MGTTSLMAPWDVLIIGGGINGAGVMRDLALHGLKVLLVEKGDFASQTSQGSSKMLHGGIRYLENMDFGLVQEALEEKNLWLKLAPRLCQEREFHMPVYRNSKWPLTAVRAGLFLYDALSHFQNKPHGHANRAQVLERFPQLKSQGLTGAGTYYDGIVDDHKLALECIWDAEIEPQCQALNYTEVIAFRPGKIAEADIRDTLSGKVTTVYAKEAIFTTGPFTDVLMQKLKLNWEPKLLTSKGIHLWLKEDALKLAGPLIIQTHDNRVVFVIPQRHAILVGTTETPAEDDIFNLRASDEDVRYLLHFLNEHFPAAGVNEQHIISTTAAVRPLVKEEGGSSVNRAKTSRFHKIFRPYTNVWSLLGGKYTTFRRMSQDLCQQITPHFGVSYNSSLTLAPLRKPSVVGTFSDTEVDHAMIEKILREEKPRTAEDLIRRRLSWLKDSSAYPEIVRQSGL